MIVLTRHGCSAEQHRAVLSTLFLTALLTAMYYHAFVVAEFVAGEEHSAALVMVRTACLSRACVH